MPLIELKNLNKTFKTKTSSVRALNDVSLSVEKGDIFGIIGLSGAGKSTLIRCINLLERPDSGGVIIDGEDIIKLGEKEIRQKRKNIGMIFQHFNLFNSRTIAQNIAYPLRYGGLTDEQIENRVKELLEIVGLESKENGYPSQLSGGQKQRVGIARALAANPQILLCDEATSALDPKTTQSILALLKELNKKLGLTIVIVTHEMSVIKAICNKAAIMENGEVIEQGAIFDIFSVPRRKATKDFIATTSNLHKVYDLLEEDSPALHLSKGETLAYFSYIGRAAVESLISTVSVMFDVRINIIFGDLDLIQGMPMGGLIVIIGGTDANKQKTIDYVGQKGVKVEVLKQYD
ncbi:MAG: methionine ABC transporter ATP-binding protein [Endomicrobium sp.]|jgi:D-methionine transport system ATP-binding protein|nr:methionine ABC transporter ATP-binding protein [Endomicrobium sp.]